jgi:hypothetical protein
MIGCVELRLRLAVHWGALHKRAVRFQALMSIANGPPRE